MAKKAKSEEKKSKDVSAGRRKKRKNMEEDEEEEQEDCSANPKCLKPTGKEVRPYFQCSLHVDLA